MTRRHANIALASNEGAERPVFATFGTGRAMVWSLADGYAGVERLSLARVFGYRAIAAWWYELTKRDDPPPPLRARLQVTEVAELSEWSKALADELGIAMAQLDAETAAYEFGLLYTGMLPREHRAKYGVYYTPPDLAARLITQATAAGVNWANCRVLDPACGGGAFLAPVARRIIDELPDCRPEILVENIATRLRGYEIDPFAAWLSQVAVDAVLLPVARRARRFLPVIVAVCDTLNKHPPSECFDLVIGNPPYGRVRLQAVDRARFKRSLFGHANLYGLFTDIALRHAKPGGVIAYVTPTSFLAGEYFKNLRALLGREARPVTIDFVSPRKGVFEEVLQETLLAAYRRDANCKTVGICEITPTDEFGLVAERVGEYPLPDELSRPWLLPRRRNQSEIVKTLSKMTHRLVDWGYRVSTGPLVWNRRKTQLSNRPGPMCYPLIWAEAISSDGRFLWRAEKKNHTPYFQVGPGDNWLVTNEQCVLLQRTTAKEQRRRLIAAPLPADFLHLHGAVVVENHLNMLRPLSDEPAVSGDVLAAFLNSAAADYAFRCVSGSVAVSAYELEALPLPAPSAIAELTSLVRANAAREVIETACAQLYRLTA